jgi:hypothetical protein
MILAGIHFPDHSQYVGAAFLVFIALLLIYLAIMSFKLTRIERDLIELNALADRGAAARGDAAAPRETETAEVAP